MWDMTIHAQPILPSHATPRAPQTGCATIEDNDDTPPNPVPAVHTDNPAIIHDNDDAPPIAKRLQTRAQLWTQAESHLINLVIQDNLMPFAPSPSNPTNFITATCRPLRHLQSRHTSLVQTQANSLAPSSTKKQVTHLNVSNSSRSSNIRTFGLIALPMNSGITPRFSQAQGHQHLFLYQEIGCPKGTHVYIWPYYLQLPSSERWTTQDSAYHGWWLHWLPLEQEHTNSPQNSFSTLLFLLLVHCSTALTSPTSIWTPQSNATNTCASGWTSLSKKLSTNTV
jgi:hypothetical protein